MAPLARHWLLITVSTPGGGSSTMRVYAWRNLRRALELLSCKHRMRAPGGRRRPRGSHDRGSWHALRAEGGPRRDASHPDDGRRAGDRGRRRDTARAGADEYRELSEHAAFARTSKGAPPRRTTYTELEESDVDLARTRSARRDPRARLLRRARRRGGRRGRRVMRGAPLARFESEACPKARRVGPTRGPPCAQSAQAEG